jgi:hypothetical protein
MSSVTLTCTIIDLASAAGGGGEVATVIETHLTARRTPVRVGPSSILDAHPARALAARASERGTA